MLEARKPKHRSGDDASRGGGSHQLSWFTCSSQSPSQQSRCAVPKRPGSGVGGVPICATPTWKFVERRQCAQRRSVCRLPLAFLISASTIHSAVLRIRRPWSYPDNVNVKRLLFSDPPKDVDMPRLYTVATADDSATTAGIMAATRRTPGARCFYEQDRYNANVCHKSE